MLDYRFHHMRDVRDEKHELAVTANRISQPFKMLNSLVNLRVDVEAGWKEDTKLYVKFEWSTDGSIFYEVGTFAIIDEHHGIIFPKWGDYIRYEIIVEGDDQCLDVVLRF